MSRTVWKHEVDVRRPVTWLIRASARAEVVAARAIDETRFNVWIECDPLGVPMNMRLFVVGTGQPVPSDCYHAVSVFCDPFVWHVYVGPLTTASQ